MCKTFPSVNMREIVPDGGEQSFVLFVMKLKTLSQFQIIFEHFWRFFIATVISAIPFPDGLSISWILLLLDKISANFIWKLLSHKAVCYVFIFIILTTTLLRTHLLWHAGQIIFKKKHFKVHFVALSQIGWARLLLGYLGCFQSVLSF